MAGNSFSAELLLSTTKANRDIQALTKQVGVLDKSLAGLGKTLQQNQKDLDSAVKGISAIVNASRDASKASEEAAKAKLSEARAQAELNKSENASQIAAARVERERSATAVNQSTVAYRNARTEAVQFANTQREISANTDKAGNSLANQRYLLYDVGATYRTLGLAAAALPTAAIAAATSYEKSFAQVIRVSGETATSAGDLRNELKQLGTEIPMTFGELSSIAQIGGQMGIATAGLAGFTETVAKFVATADGATIESSTQAFGRMANLFASDLTGEEQAEFFNSLGAAISFTADNAVTSEAKIVSMLEKIAPIGAQSGMAADEVVGLASALSSVGQQPYLSSGFMVRFFGNLNKEVAAGGDKVKAYADLLGVTSNEFKKLYANDPTAVLMRMTESLSKMSKFDMTNMLGELGIKGTNDQKVVQALAANYHVLEQAMKDTNQAYAEGTYLDKSSEGIFNTLAANLTKLANSFANLGDTVGSGILPLLSNFVGHLQWMVDGLNNLANANPAVKTMITTLASLGSVLGIWFALRSASAFLTAGLVTLTHVTKQTGSAGLGASAQLKALAQAMLVNKGASDQMAASFVRQNGALRSLSAAQSLSAGQIAVLNGQMERAGASSLKMGGGLRGVGSTLLGFVGGPIGIAVTALGVLGSAWISSANDAKNSAQEMARAAELGGDALSKTLGTTFANRKIGFFDGAPIETWGKTLGQVAANARVNIDDIAKAYEGGEESLRQFISRIDELNNKRIAAGDFEGSGSTVALIHELEKYADELKRSEEAADLSKEASKGLKGATDELTGSVDENGDALAGASAEMQNWTNELNAAIDAAFGLTNAQAGLEGSLEKLGAGLAKDKGIGLGSEGARSNLAAFQQVLSQQAALLQQSVQAGEISAQSAAQSFQQYAQNLMAQLESMGVDTSGLMNDVDNAIYAVQSKFAEQGGIELPVSVDGSQAVMETDYLMSWLSDYLSSPQYVQVASEGTDQTANDVNQLINYIAEVTGLPFTAVVDAITNPAGENTEHVAKYMKDVLAGNFQANVNADTTAAVANIQSFASFAHNQLAEIHSMAAAVAASMPGVAGIVASTALRATTFNAPAQQMVKANKSVIPSFAPLKRGYDDVGNRAAGAGKKAGGAGKKAKKAGNDAAKGSKAASKALKDQAKDWDELEQQVSGYASRVGTAFGYVTARNTGVAEAKDEYYSVLNGIKERLEAQKQQVRDLRAENKLLNAERRVQLNDAAKLEKMAGYADQMGNTERSKVYRDEAKALRESANETSSKIKANEKEAKSIEKGKGNLKGYTKEAIENRKELRSLRDASLKVAEAYAASGASAKTVERETRNWTNTAKAHGKQLGYTARDVNNVVGKTNNYVNILKRVPRTINTNLNAKNNTSGGVNSAKKALNSVPSSKTSTIKAKGSGIGNINSQLNNAGRGRTSTIRAVFDAATKRRFRALASVHTALGNYPLASVLNAASYMNRGGMVGRDGIHKFNTGGLVPGTPPANPRHDNIMATLDGEGMAAIRSGEYIHQQPAVDYYGTDIMDKLNRMEIPRYALGGAVGNRRSDGGNTPSVIELGAESIQSIARLVQKDIYLYADTELLAQSVQKGFETFAQRGGKF